ncbi:hypothetical protein ABZY81_42280 [Streptomyces sp. NPDC006514]|uniref:hypothetical protein n=1 Tax=Streptomyces sp. NPDC006514 TaxID=3154308 RepID=UPI0033BAC67E
MANFVGIPDMNITLITPRTFAFRISYTIRYTPLELTFAQGFLESLALQESDDGEVFGGTDDTYGIVQPVAFRPASLRETRTFSFTRDIDSLGTESGAEEVYAVVAHRRNIPGLLFDTRRTLIFPLAA